MYLKCIDCGESREVPPDVVKLYDRERTLANKETANAEFRTRVNSWRGRKDE